MSSRHVVLLDLDGTLIDSAPGILAGIRAAFEAVDLLPPDDSLMRAWIGPPVRETLQRELGPYGDAVVDRANVAFRAYFDTTGAYESVPFEGIHDALTAVAQAGALMSVVTHKPLPLAQIAVAQHGLDAYIEGIHAPPSPQVAVPKDQLFAEALDATRPQTVISVGDRGSDIRAAAAHGVGGIGVAWGYGDTAELHDAGALVVLSAPADLPAVVARPGSDAHARA
jgi:phosphoglycolate phosphatase